MRKSSSGLAAAFLCAVALSAGSGCASSQLRSARMAFYQGHTDVAEQALAEVADQSKGGKDQTLVFMERGAIRAAAGKYAESTADLLKAAELDEKLETKSATEQGASMVVNDSTVSYRGPPFERTLVHTMLAQNYLAMGKWQDAGVEARNIIEHMQNLDGYPDDAYSRYMAGFCLELTDDNSNAALQYRNAARVLTNAAITIRNGLIEPAGQPGQKRQNGSSELVCFILIGRSPTGFESRYPMMLMMPPPYAEFYSSNGTLLGRSYPLMNTADMIRLTMARTVVQRTAKTVARIATKEIIAEQVRNQNSELGDLVELFLLALETPDDRRWEALPMWFQVGRMPCPPDLDRVDVVFKYANGVPFRRKSLAGPIPKERTTFVAVCRDLP